MDKLSDLIRREAAGPANARTAPRIGIVTSYNDKTHAVKVKVMPEGKETGWLPLGALGIGKGFGLAVGAKAGDQVILNYLDGDHNSPVVVSRIFSDAQKAPKLKGGEIALWHESGTRHVFSKDGTHTQTHATGGTITWSKDGNHATDNGKKAVATKAGAVSTAADTVHTAASQTIRKEAGKILLNCG